MGRRARGGGGAFTSRILLAFRLESEREGEGGPRQKIKREEAIVQH